MISIACLLVACSGDENSSRDDSAAKGSPGTPQASRSLSADLRASVDAAGILRHAERFQNIADEHGGNRAAGTPGYDASAEYVAGKLRGAGYDVTVQSFEFPQYAVVRRAELEVGGVDSPDFAPMEDSGSGAAEARIMPVDAGGTTSGCEAEDFDGFRAGGVALLRRGACAFRLKAENAERAGAGAALIFNAGEANGEVLQGSLDGPGVGIPVIGTSQELGESLLSRRTMPPATVSVAEGGDNRTTNVIAQTPGGNEDGTLMVGAHLDSVPEGPGINDNGSGSATVLEIALQMAELDAEPENRVRFAFWGAEEIGLVGSRHYVENLNDEELANVFAYLNFDMLGSPNFVRTVYEGPDGVENAFESHFEAEGIETETNSALDGRSDHGPFQKADIPTGGLFSGAEGAKTGEQQEAFGGEADAPFDACYHRPCDDIDNLSRRALDELSDGAAHAVAVLAQRRGG